MRHAGSLVAVVVSGLLAGCADRPLYWPGLDPNTGAVDGGVGGDGGGRGDGGPLGGPDGGQRGDGAVTGGDGGGPVPASPRLLSPLSTARVTSRRPRLRWDSTGTSGAASVELCADRACTRPAGAATVDASGTAARPDADLPRGPVFWRVRTGGQVSATWELFVGLESAPRDSSFGAALDLDGDGVSEVAAGTSTGVIVWAGVRIALSAPSVSLVSPDGPKARFGAFLAPAGDVNGDGYGDLAVGECGQSPGRVHVYFGGPDLLDPARSQALDSPDGKSGFGCRLAAAGDLDGDGYADLVVARIGQDFSGGLYLYRGGPNGLPSTAVRLDSPNRNPSRIGHSLAGVGDLDGDGYDDFVASEIEYNDLSGQVHVYHGGPDGLSNARVTSLASPDGSGLQYGSSVSAAGDVNGDGNPDFVVASAATPSATQPARAHLYLGGPGPLSPTGITLRTNGDVGFASEAEGGQDLDSDGYDDVVIASPDRLDFFRGGPQLAPNGVSVAVPMQATSARHLRLVGDLDFDGFADTAVVVPPRVILYRGGPGGLDAGRQLAVPPPSDPLQGPLAARVVDFGSTGRA